MTSNSIGLLSIQLGQTVQEKEFQCTHLLLPQVLSFRILNLVYDLQQFLLLTEPRSLEEKQEEMGEW